MTSIDTSNDENTMRRIIYGYKYSLKIKICMENKTTQNCLTSTVILETFGKFVG